MGWFWKKKEVPETNEMREVTAVQLWMVEWISVHHYVSTHYNGRREVEAFPSKDDAEAFATSLRQAAKLLKSDISTVTVRKNA